MTTTEQPMMRCGHRANAIRTTPTGNVPCCAICMGADALEINTTPPTLTGRTARCAYFGGPLRMNGARGTSECRACNERHADHSANTCQCEVPSVTPGLAFFEYCGPGATAKAPQPFDRFYCGCMGWD